MTTIQHPKVHVHNQELSALLSRFEAEHSDYLLAEEVDGWNVWFSIKKTVFYFLKNQDRSAGSGAQQARSGRSGVLLSFLRLAFNLIRYIPRRGKLDVFITTKANKLAKDANNGSLDPFIDPLITEGIVKNYLYLELSGDGKAVKPTPVTNFNEDGRSLPIAFFRRKYAGRQDILDVANKLSGRLDHWLAENGSSLKVGSDHIFLFISNYLAQVKWYSLLWKLLKPKRLFTVDVIPEGSIGAAVKLRIPTYEFQHGFVSLDKPDYIIPKFLSPKKRSMPVPGFICVFGSYFKDLVTRSGFWKNDEVISIGSYVVDEARKEKESNSTESASHILWTTQPSMFGQTCALLNELVEMQPKGFHIKLKFHPLDSADNRKWYRGFCASHPSLFSVEEEPIFFKALKHADLLISFHSTTLLEAVAVGCPAISIATGKFTKGMSDFVDADVSAVIRTAENSSDIINIINIFMQDQEFAREWKTECRRVGNYFFEPGYKEKIHKYFN